ncbi:MAG: hypothetical protein JWM35_2166 [Verrucomicrobia bacterium]|nr:hypothetical protein [Verrucomicrobiota bacterium]
MAPLELQAENLAQLSFDRELALCGHATVINEDFFAGNLDHEMATTSGLIFKAVCRVEKDFVFSNWTVARPERTAHQSIQIAIIRVRGHTIR